MKKELLILMTYLTAFVVQIFGICIPLANKAMDISIKRNINNEQITGNEIGILILMILLSILLWKIVAIIEKTISRRM